MRIFALHAAYPRSALQASDLAPITTIIAEMPLWWSPGWRGSNMRGGVRQWGCRKESVELGLTDWRRDRAANVEEGVIVEVHARGCRV